ANRSPRRFAVIRRHAMPRPRSGRAIRRRGGVAGEPRPENECRTLEPPPSASRVGERARAARAVLRVGVRHRPAAAGTGPGIRPLRRIGSPLWINVGFSLALAILPAIPVTTFEIRRTRRLLLSGYRPADLRFAIRSWRTERAATIEEEARALGPWQRRL